MKRQLSVFILLYFFTLNSCKSQEILVKDLANEVDMNYIFARINPTQISSTSLYNNGLFVNIYKLSDSKITPEKFKEDFLSSYLVSVIPDGDYYSYSKLYKIEGLYNPKIIEVKETQGLFNFIIKIEFGIYNNRQIQNFELEGGLK
jgi:hypothetical protein